MRTRTEAILLAGLLLGLLLAPVPASAHSFLREAKPGVDATVQRAPKRVLLWFNEPVEAEFARITVTTRQGRWIRAEPPLPVTDTNDRLMIRLHRSLAAGRYIVRWRVVSADSHIQAGRFSFRVKRGDRPGGQAAAAAEAGGGGTAGGGTAGGTGAEAGSASAPDAPMGAGEDVMVAGGGTAARLVATARGFTTMGLLLLVGLIVFWLLAWRGPGPALAPPPDVQRAFVHRWRQIAAVALALTVAATLSGVVMQGAAAAGVPLGSALRGDIIQGVLATGFGKAAVGRVVLLELLAILAVLWHVVPLFVARRPARAVGAAALNPGISNRHLILFSAVVLPLLLTMSMVSHATVASPVVLHLAADAVHLAAAGAWIGGIVVLGCAAFPATRALAPAERVRVLGPAVVRFSRIAAVGVALVVVTGTFRGVATVGGWEGLTTTAYGTALLVKLAVFAALLMLGAFNHLWAVRRIRAAAAAGTHTGALQALRRSVAVETCLATVIVTTTAVLVSLPMGAA